MANDDYLPKAQPNPEPPERTSKVGTLVLWVVIILLFVAVYNLFDSPHALASSPPPPVGIAAWWLVVAFSVGVLPALLLLWSLRAAGQYQERHLRALAATLRGNLPDAIKQFRALLAHNRFKVAYTGPLHLDLGMTLLRSGQLDEAAAEFLTVERSLAVPYVGDRRGSAATWLARLFAVAGDVTKARLWLDHARARLNADDVHAQMMLVTAEVLVALRTDDAAQALGLLDRHRPVLQAALSVAVMRELWLLEAFAISHETGPREAAAAQTALAWLSTAQPGELAWMWQRWPALATFAETHHLAG